MAQKCDAAVVTLPDCQQIVQLTATSDIKRLVQHLRAQRFELSTSVNNHNQTLLHIAAAAGASKSVATLCNLGAPVDAVDSNGRTALHLAVQHSHETVVALLLDCGADPAKRVKNPMTGGFNSLFFSSPKNALDLAREAGELATSDTYMKLPQQQEAAVRIHERLDKAMCSNTTQAQECLACDTEACAVS
jgi:ankyrin repeat protein